MRSITLELIAIFVSITALASSNLFSWIQTRNAERTRKSQIAPHVTAYTHTPIDDDVLLLIIENVGFGAARNVRARAVKGADFMRCGEEEDPLSRWRPLSAPIPVLPVSRPLQTVLASPIYQDFATYSKEEIVIEIAYEDVEGTRFAPETFPKIQIITVRELLAGVRPRIPAGAMNVSLEQKAVRTLETPLFSGQPEVGGPLRPTPERKPAPSRKENPTVALTVGSQETDGLSSFPVRLEPETSQPGRLGVARLEAPTGGQLRTLIAAVARGCFSFDLDALHSA